MARRVELRLPRLSMAAMEVTFIEWLVADGSQIAKGDPVYSIDTEKVQTEIEALSSGVLRHGTILPGEIYPVGTVVGWIDPE